VSGLRLIFAGTPAVALPSLDAIAASSHELLAVVTRPDAPAGRGRRLVRSPAGAWADEHGIEVLTPGRPREPEFQQRLRDLEPDCVPVVAYGALVPPSALEIPKHGWVNLHFSLLPAWRGAAPVQHAVLHGDEVTGASVFELEAGLDTGPVYGTLTEDIRPADTSGDLLERLAGEGAGLLVAVLDAIEAGTARAHPQPADGVTIAPKITIEDARIRWDDPAFAVDRRIRACTPAPGAWTLLRDDRLKLGPVKPVANGPRLSPGDLLVERSQVLVGTATTPVALGEVRAAGKKPMPATDWARGLRIQPGEKLQ
jgi:methionyl-tRNA formyltransferase